MKLIDEWDLRATRAQGDWIEYSVDLSGVTGLEPGEFYFAIRHFNCTDMFFIVVDDVTVTGLTIEPVFDGSVVNNGGTVTAMAGYYLEKPEPLARNGRPLFFTRQRSFLLSACYHRTI